jgi:hypothetical protein
MLNGQADTYYRDADNINAGTLDEAYGGTGQSSYTKGDLLVPSGATTITKVGVGSNGQILMADSSETAGVKWGNPNHAVIMMLQDPESNERSASIKLPRAMSATKFDLLADTSPSSSVTVQIYKNGSLLDSLSISSTTANKSVSHSLAEDDVLYMKLSGSPYGITKLTGQLKVS